MLSSGNVRTRGVTDVKSLGGGHTKTVADRLEGHGMRLLETEFLGAHDRGKVEFRRDDAGPKPLVVGIGEHREQVVVRELPNDLLRVGEHRCMAMEAFFHPQK
jgi:hypothetical protein